MQVGNVRFLVASELDEDNVRQLRQEWPDGELVPPWSKRRTGWLKVLAAALLVAGLLVVVVAVVRHVDATVPQRTNAPHVSDLREGRPDQVDRRSFVERGSR